MNARITALTIVIFAVAGCGGSHSYWYQQGKTLEQARADCRDCQRQAWQEAGEAAADEYISHIDSPLHRRGDYGTFHDRVESDDDLIGSWPSDGGVYEQNVFAGCMKHKGYQKLKAHRLPPKTRTKSLSLGAVAGR
jgi:hypothetical protein